MTAVSSRFRICATKVLAFGTSSRVSSSYRDIAEFAIKSDCDIFFIAHNHPHGEAKPSDSDMLFTRNALKALSTLGAVLADHIIIGAEGGFSIRSSGLLPEMKPDGVKGYK